MRTIQLHHRSRNVVMKSRATPRLRKPSRSPAARGCSRRLHTTLCRAACDTAPGTGSFARAEASLLYEGTQYNWPLSEQEGGFDGSGPFLATRMQTCIANAMEGEGPDGGAFRDAIRCGSRAKITAFTTVQPIMKPLPDAPRDHEENALDLVVVTNGGRYLYTNKCLRDGTVVPLAYAVRERSEALLCSTATMHFETDIPCPCGASSTKHSATAKFDTTTGVPTLLIEHKTDNESFPCSLQPTAGWSASPLDIGRVLQVSTWPEHEVRALQAERPLIPPSKTCNHQPSWPRHRCRQDESRRGRRFGTVWPAKQERAFYRVWAARTTRTHS